MNTTPSTTPTAVVIAPQRAYQTAGIPVATALAAGGGILCNHTEGIVG